MVNFTIRFDKIMKANYERSGNEVCANTAVKPSSEGARFTDIKTVRTAVQMKCGH